MNSYKKENLQSHFPRTIELPTQSPKYWAKEKDRYLRQLLIGDIEAQTGRSLIVYFSQLDQGINHTDPDDISEILSGIEEGEPFDLFLQTPGGLVDATEKIVSVLKNFTNDYRVAVPSWAKSGGTVVALSSTEIVLGINSELGPIDPQFQIDGWQIPADVAAEDPEIPQRHRTIFKNASNRMKRMALEYLSNGMMANADQSKLDETIAKLSSTDGYLSHGAVIDHLEAKNLGLNVNYLEPSDELWRRIWLLYCMYDFDTKQMGYGRVIESLKYSISRTR